MTRIRRYTPLPLVILMSLASAGASAQQDVIDRCKQTSSKDDRIACLEAAMLMRDAKPAQTAPSSKVGETDIGAEQVIARQQTQEERVAALEQAAGLKVTKYESLAHDRLQVTLEDGQVWRQIRGDTQKVPATLKKNQTVDISESSLGGYRLRLNEMRRTIRVQRIR